MTSEMFKDIFHVPPKISLSQGSPISSNTSSPVVVYGAFTILFSLADGPVYQGSSCSVSSGIETLISIGYFDQFRLWSDFPLP